MDTEVILTLAAFPKSVNLSTSPFLEIRLRKLVDEREKMIEQVGHWRGFTVLLCQWRLWWSSGEEFHPLPWKTIRTEENSTFLYIAV